MAAAIDTKDFGLVTMVLSVASIDRRAIDDGSGVSCLRPSKGGEWRRRGKKSAAATEENYSPGRPRILNEIQRRASSDPKKEISLVHHHRRTCTAVPAGHASSPAGADFEPARSDDSLCCRPRRTADSRRRFQYWHPNTARPARITPRSPGRDSSKSLRARVDVIFAITSGLGPRPFLAGLRNSGAAAASAVLHDRPR